MSLVLVIGKGFGDTLAASLPILRLCYDFVRDASTALDDVIDHYTFPTGLTVAQDTASREAASR